jgi:hypothetical protein
VSKGWPGLCASTTLSVRTLKTKSWICLSDNLPSRHPRFDIPSNEDRHDSNWRLWVDSVISYHGVIMLTNLPQSVSTPDSILSLGLWSSVSWEKPNSSL